LALGAVMSFNRVGGFPASIAPAAVAAKRVRGSIGANGSAVGLWCR